MFGSFPKTPYLCTRNSEFATPHSTFRSEKSAVLNNKNDAPVAQLVEHLTLNQGVQGSNPCGCTKERLSPLFFVVCYFHFIIFLDYLMVIHTGSPRSFASTIFCSRRWSQMRESTT